MIPGDVIAAGTTAGTITLNPTARTVGWVVMATTAVAVTVQFDTGPVITIPAVNAQFVEFAGDYQKMTVTGGTVAYFVVG